MRVIHIFASDLKSISEGGIASYIREIIKHASSQMDISLVGVTGDSKDAIGEWNSNEQFNFLPLFYTSQSHITYKRGIPLNAKFLLALWFNKRKILSKNCILHIHRIELALPFLYSRNKKTIILTIHGFGNAIELAATHPLFCRKWFRKLYYTIESLVIKKVDKIILVSCEGLNYYLTKYPKERNKFIFIPTMVDTNLFRPMDKQILRRRFGFKNTEKVILFIGRFDYPKGLGLLIGSFGKLKVHIPEIKLVMVGEGAEKIRLEEQISLNGINGVIFKDAMPHDNLPEIINCADLFVLTSIWEGLPMSVLEALACGLPVVSTNVGHLSHIIKDGFTGYLVGSRDPEELKRKIILALKNAENMKNNCIEAVKEYSSAVISKRIEQIYEELCEGSNGSSRDN